MKNTNPINTTTLLKVFISEGFAEEVDYTGSSNLPLAVGPGERVNVTINFGYSEDKTYRFRFVCDDGEVEFYEYSPQSYLDSITLVGVGWERASIYIYLGCMTSKPSLTITRCLLNSTDVTSFTNLPISVRPGHLAILKIAIDYQRNAFYAVEVQTKSRSFNFTIASPPAAFTFGSADIDPDNNWITFTVVAHENLIVQSVELSLDNETFVDVTDSSSVPISPLLRAGQVSFLYIMFPNGLATRVSSEDHYYVRLTMTNGEAYVHELG